MLSRPETGRGRRCRRDAQGRAGQPQRGQGARAARALRGAALRGGVGARLSRACPRSSRTAPRSLGNATRKALVTAAYTGEIAVADDTSLQVRVLNGLPDIFAARFAGPGATYAQQRGPAAGPDGATCRTARARPASRSACAWIDPRPGRGRRPGGRRPAAQALAAQSVGARDRRSRIPAEEPEFWNALMRPARRCGPTTAPP